MKLIKDVNALNNIKNRYKNNISLKYFNNENEPEYIGKIDNNFKIPNHYINILRMLISEDGKNFIIPKEINFLKYFLDVILKHQKINGFKNKYCYVTIKNNVNENYDNDVWHTDGFSMKVKHKPEQNYIFCSSNPTEYVLQKIKFPIDFNPQIYNVHKYIQKRIVNKIMKIDDNTLYCIDPYVIHRRPQLKGLNRFFIRITFSNIEINDINQTQNPKFLKKYTLNGYKFREKLLDYDIIKGVEYNEIN
jgi:hypothetical protein